MIFIGNLDRIKILDGNTLIWEGDEKEADKIAMSPIAYVGGANIINDKCKLISGNFESGDFEVSIRENEKYSAILLFKNSKICKISVNEIGQFVY
jgi:hypothetical protein